ncbi:lachesin-like [Onthophagus taurus]|uniref:lachesin-like n=1 Tax=Onthophagus taurus TaxID=166361 RepID=UPI0039BEAC3D
MWSWDAGSGARAILFMFTANFFGPAALGKLDSIHDSPKFTTPIANVTVPVGREAILECVVDNLSNFRIAWLRVDTQTILTIYIHVITKNHRINVSHSEHKTWYLHIRDVRESDRGWYMCQINTDPMKSQIGYLDVVVPPDILDYPTSTDMVVREGSNVSLRCAATGSPEPMIAWRREGGEPIPIGNGLEAPSIEGSIFNITRVNRLHMGPYLCIASNGVPPSVSKRISLIVHFPPMIWIQNQLVGAMIAQEITLECHSEAYPKSINYWTKDGGNIISQGAKYEPIMVDNAYKVHMKLTIKSVGQNDYGSYKCVSKNSLGETDGTIKLYHIPSPSTEAEETTTPTTTLVTKPTFKEFTTKLPKKKKQKSTESSGSSNVITDTKPTKGRDIRQRSSPNDLNKEKLAAINDIAPSLPSKANINGVRSSKCCYKVGFWVCLYFMMAFKKI